MAEQLKQTAEQALKTILKDSALDVEKFFDQYLSKEFNILPLIIPKEYQAKDFSELIMKNNKQKINKLIINTINQIKQYAEDKYNGDPF